VTILRISVLLLRAEEQKGPDLARFFTQLYFKPVGRFLLNLPAQKGYIIFNMLLMTTTLACIV
jgi:hypothetical protein